MKKNQLKKLQSLWYKIIAVTPDKNGEVFKDIEDTSRDDSPLKAWHDYRFKHIPIEQRMAAATYYDLAMAALHTHRFLNDTHKRIWELYCEGLSRRKIAKNIAGMTPTYGQARIGEIILEISVEIKGTKCK